MDGSKVRSRQLEVTVVVAGTGRVAVGVDGSEESYRAVDRAVELAVATTAHVHVVHAHGGPGSAALREELAAEYGRGGSPQAQGLLDVAVAYARERLRPLEATAQVTGALHIGSAAGALLEESRHASVVVIGYRRHGGLTGLLLGSVAVPLSAHAHCPVVVVRGADAKHLRADARASVSVLRASSSSSAGEGMTATTSGPPIHVSSHVITAMRGQPRRSASTAAKRRAGVDLLVPSTPTTTLSPIATEHPGVSITSLVEQGNPAHVLLRHADGARMVVVGSRGRGGFTGLLLGSTSQTLLHRSPVDIAVVRH